MLWLGFLTFVDYISPSSIAQSSYWGSGRKWRKGSLEGSFDEKINNTRSRTTH